MKVVAGAGVVPDIFEIIEFKEQASVRVKAPDGTEATIEIDFKIYNEEDFFQSIEELKGSLKEAKKQKE